MRSSYYRWKMQLVLYLCFVDAILTRKYVFSERSAKFMLQIFNYDINLFRIHITVMSIMTKSISLSPNLRSKLHILLCINNFILKRGFLLKRYKTSFFFCINTHCEHYNATNLKSWVRFRYSSCLTYFLQALITFYAFFLKLTVLNTLKCYLIAF